MSVLSVSVWKCDTHHKYHISKYEIIRNIICIFNQKMLELNSKQKPTRRRTMSVSNATYKVGDTYTSQKSKVVGTITEIVPTNKNTVRVKLDVNGATRWTTWTAK